MTVLSVLLVDTNDHAFMPQGIELRRAPATADAANQSRIRAFDLIVAAQPRAVWQNFKRSPGWHT
ncbi:MAG: hypothetical protein ABJE66_10085 [Deltaproteobacteria bacterium]